jgi:CheY-like chemotaxis protein
MNAGSNGEIRAILVEDNSADAYWLEMVLVEMDRPLSVERFENGVDALKSLRSGRRKPDVLLLDWRLPLLEAPEVIAEVRALPDYAEMPIAVFTEFEDQQRQAQELGAFFILNKPVGRHQIEGLLEALARAARPPAQDAVGAPLHRLG